MYTLIIIFYVSLVAMVAMLLLKRREVAGGAPSTVSRIGAGTDHVFQRVFSAVGNALSYFNRHTFKFLAQLVAFQILKTVRTIYVEIKDRFISHPQGKKLIDAVRGKGEVSDHGASFYLRRIASKDK